MAGAECDRAAVESQAPARRCAPAPAPSSPVFIQLPTSASPAIFLQMQTSCHEREH